MRSALRRQAGVGENCGAASDQAWAPSSPGRRSSWRGALLLLLPALAGLAAAPAGAQDNPDLVFTTLTDAPEPVVAGQQLTITALITNSAAETDPNFANYLYQPESGRVVLLDFGATMRFPPAFVANYVRITRAVIEADRDAVAQEAILIGYAGADDSPERLQAMTDIIFLVCEPLRHRGRYDFPASDLPARVRDLGYDLTFRQGLVRAPPPETIFLHRKLVGSFLLLARIGARVDARALVLESLGGREID